MKPRIAYWVLFALAIWAIVVAASFPSVAQAQVAPPSRGGTGVSTTPQYGQVLVGCQNFAGLWVYCPTATSSLGITSGAGGLATTSIDTESELETILTDVTNVFTNNDGALSDDNLSNNTTSDLPEGSNLYYTLARFQSALIGGYNAILGNATSTNATSTNLAVSGSFNFLGTVITNVSTWFNGLFDTRLATKSTSDLSEGSNLYFTTARVLTYLDTLTKGYFFSTTSADHWKTERNFHSTSSADYWETQQTARTADDLSNNSIEDLPDVAAITENYGDLLGWNGSTWTDFATSSLGLPTFSYPFPSNATGTQITFNAGLVGNLTGNANTATALATNGSNCSSGSAPLGVDASGASENCFDVWTEAENTSAAYTPQARTITVVGTGNQITSSAGAQDLSANRTWTLSLPSHVAFPGNFRAANATTTNATTTAFDITSLLTFGGITGNSWDDFCTAITGGSGLCDGVDDAGGGGSSDPFTHPAAGQSATTSLMLFNGNASSTQLSATKAYFGGTATTSIFSNGFVGIGSSSPYSNLAIQSNYGDGPILLAMGSSTSSGFDNIFEFNKSGLIRFFGREQTAIRPESNGTLSLLSDGAGLYLYYAAGERLSFSNDINLSPLDAPDKAVRVNGTYAGFMVGTSSSFSRIAFGAEAGRWALAVGSSTRTLFGITDKGTTTIGYGLDISNALATSSSNVGWNITSGCYAINGTCLSTGSSANPFEIATTSNIANSQLAYFTNTTGRTTLGGAATTTLSGNSQIALSQPINVLGGSASTLSIVADSIGDTQLAFNTGQNLTTASSPSFAGLTVGSLSGVLIGSSGVISIGVDGTDYSLINAISCTNQVLTALTAAGVGTCSSVSNAMLTNSTISGISLGSNLADLTATNGTLSFSGSYNGSAARTIGLNLANANTWSALQTFSYASSTGLSSSYASSTVWRGGGLTTDCDTPASSKLLWDATTGQFSCGSDQTGGGSTPDSKWATSSNDAAAIYPAGASRVGIGTTTPAVSLNIAASGDLGGIGSVVMLTDPAASTDQKHWAIFNGNATLGGFGFIPLNDDLTPKSYFPLNALPDGSTVAFAIGYQSLTMFDGGAAGLVGISTTTPWAKLSINPVAADGAAPAFVIGSSTGTSLIVDNKRHLGLGGFTPSVGTCGTSPSLTTGGDNTGVIRIGTGAVSACTLTFARAYTSAPQCFVNINKNIATGTELTASTTATALLITASPSNIGGTQISYFCVANAPRN